MRAYAVATCAVLPLLAASIWTGASVGLTDPVLGVVSAAEQPLSVGSPGAVWAMVLVLAWFAFAYSYRQFAVWEAALLLIGGTVALVRAGNLWLLGIALLLPLARQFGRAPRLGSVAAACVGIAVAIATALGTRPPSLPASAIAAVPTQASVLADWRWSSDLERASRATVLGADGLRSEPKTFWLDYLRVTRGHERWSQILREYGVNVVVLNTAETPLAAELLRTSPEWHITADADGAVVAQRLP